MEMKWNDVNYIHYITNKTELYNMDNISRTKAYQNLYFQLPELKWAFVASIVSRNAGWNMTDLYLKPFKSMLSNKERVRLFMTYERANWLIFSDAYPQLEIYRISKEIQKPMFHLLNHFKVSKFMEREWNYFWQYKDRDRLLIALIINEQNVIHHPIVKQPFYKHHVFLSMPYLMQNFFWMNAVLLPTFDTRIYGANVHGFTKLQNRISLGKKLASIIFHPDVYDDLVLFTKQTEHTGSRKDYERNIGISLPTAPMLRAIYPVVDHQDIIRKDWFTLEGIKASWLLPKRTKIDSSIGNTFYKKRHLLWSYMHLKTLWDK
ncbi:MULTISPECIES: DUF2515 family protein [unclassified Virgibacillus]|uniref:DUF2515 family protein n=1 Tax=unclassified Virgibacillus TaxID=2620237 RepID=UPI0024DE0E79|nr:DUF2515 family protein [Virgibacillus sp. LDC-1]